MNDTDRLPPHSRDSERAMLGTMLRDGKAIPEIVMLMRAEEFYVFSHQLIFSAIAAIADAGQDANIVTVAEKLTADKKLDDTGGHRYLAELYDASPSAAAFRQYAATIREHWMRRELIHACTDLQADAFDLGTSAQEVIEQAERRVFAIADSTVASDTCELHVALSASALRTEARIHRNATGETDGVPTGLIDLDSLLCGFQRGELIIVAARPSVGKTALGLQFAAHAAIERDMPTLFVSLEQSRTELADRLLCSYGRVNSHNMRRGFLNTDEQSRLIEASAKLGRAHLFLDDSPQQGMTRIGANARRLKARKEIAAVFVDYLQLVDPDDRRANRQEQVSSVSRRLKHLARELQIPVVAMAQLNRGTEDRSGGEPKLSDLRESGAIEQDADTVILLHRVDDPGTGFAEIGVQVAKQRNGPTGKLKLLYDKPHMRFENADKDYYGNEVRP